MSIDLILASLLDSFAHFVLNYRMNDITSTILELINMLKTVEPSIKKKGKSMMLVDSSSSKNKNNKKKKSTKPKGGVAKKKAKETAPKGTCFHCGHWKRNWKVYLESMKKKAFDALSTLGMFVIKVNIVSINNLYEYWIPVVTHTYALICKA